LWVALPAALALASSAVAAFLWAVRSGQLDDVETPAVRMLFDDVPRRSVRPDSSGTGTRGATKRPPASPPHEEIAEPAIGCKSAPQQPVEASRT
jgi:cbb3-type cytochrome oxidase maturation protein